MRPSFVRAFKTVTSSCIRAPPSIRTLAPAKFSFKLGPLSARTFSTDPEVFPPNSDSEVSNQGSPRSEGQGEFDGETFRIPVATLAKDPKFLKSLATDPEIVEMLSDPVLMSKFQELITNPHLVDSIEDPKLQKVVRKIKAVFMDDLPGFGPGEGQGFGNSGSN